MLHLSELCEHHLAHSTHSVYTPLSVLQPPHSFHLIPLESFFADPGSLDHLKTLDSWLLTSLQPFFLLSSFFYFALYSHFADLPTLPSRTSDLAKVDTSGLWGPLPSPSTHLLRLLGPRLTDVLPIHVVEERDAVELGAGIVEGTHQPRTVPQLPGPGCLDEHVVACSEGEMRQQPPLTQACRPITLGLTLSCWVPGPRAGVPARYGRGSGHGSRVLGPFANFSSF